MWKLATDEDINSRMLHIDVDMLYGDPGVEEEEERQKRGTLKATLLMRGLLSRLLQLLPVKKPKSRQNLHL